MNQTRDSGNYENSIRDDILTMVGGHFTPQALSRPVYEEILLRAKANAKEYLALFESLFLSGDFKFFAQSDLLLPTFLHLLAPAEPEGVKVIAEQLLGKYNTVIASPDTITEQSFGLQPTSEENTRLQQRIDGYRMELQELIELMIDYV